VRGGI